MKLHVTTCPKCGGTWQNPDNRDYSKDVCSRCGTPLEYKGTIEVKVASIPNPKSKTEAIFREGLE